MPYELNCIKCGKKETFTLNWPITSYICEKCEKEAKQNG